MTVPEEPPVMPTADEVAARADAPRVVRISFWVLVAAGVSGIVGAVLFLALRADWARLRVERAPELRLSDVQANATTLSWWLVIGTVTFLGFFVLLSTQARRGVRKARTLLLVVGVFATLFEYSIGRVTVYGLFSALLTVVGVGLLFFKSARPFYPHDGER
ncbi:hypothetical protein V5P93_006940 [Actinokineospora auranticolor]|uniref:Uncharacterized protein n=1 Tax=Actinokineospora auranticolor TaxID=155976 RepID=A0A2S6GW47_9PSEU|nr:hypothetical protein [Actinokineospora auranticolor]PPK69418.1 hypothetical protein CLV40_10324 [Actinokineospora auranticolor]